MPRLLLFVVFALAALPAHAQTVDVGEGGYTTVLPSGETGPILANDQPATPLVADGVTGPIPTNDWWSSLLWPRLGNRHSEPMYPHPLALQAQASGLQIRYPTQVGGGRDFFFYAGPPDLSLEAIGLNVSETRVQSWGDFTVTAEWGESLTQMEATFGHGLPFVFVRLDGGDAFIRPIGNSTIWKNEGEVVGLTVNGHHYGLFAPTGAEWTGSGSLQSDLAGAGFYSVALLPDASDATLEFFRKRAYAFPVDSRVAWEYDEATRAVTTTFSVETELLESGADRLNETLLALYPHQWKASSAALEAMSYASPRGQMRLVAASGFSTELTFGGVLPALPGLCQPDGRLADVVTDETFRRDQIPGNLDSYFGGKALARVAHMIPLAEQVGNDRARTSWLNELRGATEDWLIPGGQQFYYEPTWGSLIGFPDSFGSSRELNDHHFHYGYHVMAAAAIAARDPDWATRFGPMVELIIRDVASADREDPLFPFLRTFDPYAGHSWASGHANFPDGNNQEASSESMNFASALILWGEETGNVELRDLGIFLYANERSAIDQYWFDVENSIFPSSFGHTAVGAVWGNKGAWETFFGDEPEYIHGINFIPIHAGSLYLGRNPAYVVSNYLDMRAANGGDPDQWQDLMWGYLALGNAEEALLQLDSNTYNPEGGESRSRTYHWISNLADLGFFEPFVTADSPTAASFIKDGVRTRVAYNAGTQARVVTFSDGETLDVPAGSLVRSCPPSIAIQDPVTPTTPFSLGAAYPQPFTGTVSVPVTLPPGAEGSAILYDVLGRRITSMPVSGDQPIVIDGTRLSPGPYVLRVTLGTRADSRMLVRAIR